MSGAQVKAVCAIIKKRFTNMGVEETIDFATQLIEAVETTKYSFEQATTKQDDDDDLPF